MIGMYQISIGIFVGIYIILALGLNIITGLAGQISLGHAAFFGIGAYSSALLALRLGIPFWIALPLAAIITAIMGALVGLASLRVREDFLAITTMGINFVVVAIFLYSPFFGGALGLGNIPMPTIFGSTLSKPVYFLLILAMVVGCIVFNWKLLRCWIGLALEGIREDEDASAAIGIDVRLYKLVAFTIGTGFAGLAGSLYAHYMGFISATDFGFPFSITILCMVVLGGIGTIYGPIVGAIILGVAPEIFRPLMEYRMLMYGALLLLVMRFQPSGLLGRGSIIRERLSVFLREKLKRKEPRLVFR